MNFIFQCSTRHFTRSLRSLVTYRVEHSKLKFISTRRHVISSIYVMRLKNIEMGIFMLTSMSLIWQQFLFCFVCCYVLFYKIMELVHVHFIRKRTNMNIGPFVLPLSLLQTLQFPQTWFGILRQTKSCILTGLCE